MPTKQNFGDIISCSNQIIIKHSIALIHKLPVAAFVSDCNAKIVDFNNVALELGSKFSEVGVNPWYNSSKVYHADGTTFSSESTILSITTNQQKSIQGEEIILEKVDGNRSHIKVYSEPLYDENQVFQGSITTLIDTTEAKLKDALITENEEKFQTLSESLEKTVEKRTATLKKSEEKYHKMIIEIEDYAILLLDSDGNVMNWNKGAEKIKGYSADEIIGKNFSVFYLDSDRKDKLPQRLIEEARKNGRAMHEGYRVRKDGTLFWGYVVITALHEQSGNVIGFSKVTRDLTERKVAEDKLKNFAKDIEIRNKQLEEYAFVASHDLQEPIRKIQIFSELIKDDIQNTERVLMSADKINKSAKRMSELITEVLKYSQLSATHDLMQPTNLQTVLDNVLEDLDLFISEKKVIIHHDDLPIIMAIPIQMHQLFFNLIGNAIKFTHHNPFITISCSAIPPDEHNQIGAVIQLKFTDNGVGFEQKYASQVFKLFKRLSTNQSGTGIGLALCKKIVDNHDGQIRVQSEIGVGTTFEVDLPVGDIN